MNSEGGFQRIIGAGTRTDLRIKLFHELYSKKVPCSICGNLLMRWLMSRAKLDPPYSHFLYGIIQCKCGLWAHFHCLIKNEKVVQEGWIKQKFELRCPGCNGLLRKGGHSQEPTESLTVDWSSSWLGKKWIASETPALHTEVFYFAEEVQRFGDIIRTTEIIKEDSH